jgi:hypothetical protein
MEHIGLIGLVFSAVAVCMSVVRIYMMRKYPRKHPFELL